MSGLYVAILRIYSVRWLSKDSVFNSLLHFLPTICLETSHYADLGRYNTKEIQALSLGNVHGIALR